MYLQIGLPSGFTKTLTYECPSEFDVKIGDWVEVPLRKKRVWAIVVDLEKEKPEFETQRVVQVSSNFAFNSHQMNFYSWISKYYLSPINRVLDSVLPKDFSELATGKELSKRAKALKSIPDNLSEEPDLSLNKEQEAALEKYHQNKSQGVMRFLLDGVTGSGKTRLMAHMAQDVLAKGRSVLWMVPEIALTQQNLSELSRMLGVEVHLVHSGLTPVARKKLWHENKEGKVKVLLGTRSSVLFPLKDPGLIIVDEEHDGSYKQFDPTPRYNAKDSALYLSFLLKIPCVLASATPSLESIHLVSQNKLSVLTLKNRTNKIDLPSVRLVDQKAQSKLQGKKILSIPLREAIKEKLSLGQQIILLHNRRGYSRALSCNDCGESFKCHDCSVPLTWHQDVSRFQCHTCARLYMYPSDCQSCSSKDIELMGDGIEKTEEELKLYFPGIKMGRLDRDTASTPKKLEAILSSFRQGEFDVLLGTQMVAKGHDFPKVSLVGVIDGDIGNLLPDFRSDERQFQLLTQVFGRAGRADIPGQVIVQTRQPENEIISWASKNDTASFVKQEMDFRKKLDFPPFSKILMIELSGSDENEAFDWAQRIKLTLEKEGMEYGIRVNGPLAPMVAKAAKKYRFRLILQSKESQKLNWIFNQVIDKVKVPSTLKVTADMDPQSVLI